MSDKNYNPNLSPDIVLPTWDQIGKQFIGMGRSRGDVTWILHESGRQPKWEDKIDKGLFRGRDSNLARLTISELSLKYPGKDFQNNLKQKIILI